MASRRSLLLLSLLALQSCAPQPGAVQEQALSFPVATPRLAPATFERTYVTRLAASRRSEIRVRVRGVVESVHVDEGQRVEKGDLLFVIDARELEHELARARAVRKTAEAELETARIERANTALLHGRNVVSDSELSMAEARWMAARARVEEARAAENQAELSVRHAQVRAPFAGVVGRILLKAGATVEEGAQLTTLTDPSEIFAYFRVSEQEYLAGWAQGRDEGIREVALRLADGQPYGHPGRIDARETEVDPATGSIGLRARFPNPEGLLLHGGSGTIAVQLPLGEGLLVPQKSTFQVQDRIFVYSLDDEGRVRARQIVPDRRMGEFFVVRSGLEADERILVEGIQHVREGDRVAARPIALTAAAD